MNVSLTPQLETMIHEKVVTGKYGSASEVVREALRLLDERDQAREAKLAALRAALDEGEHSPAAPLEDVDTLLSQFREERGRDRAPNSNRS